MARNDSEKTWRRHLRQIDEALKVVHVPDQRRRLMELKAEIQAKLNEGSRTPEMSGTD